MFFSGPKKSARKSASNMENETRRWQSQMAVTDVAVVRQKQMQMLDADGFVFWKSLENTESAAERFAKECNQQQQQQQQQQRGKSLSPSTQKWDYHFARRFFSRCSSAALLLPLPPLLFYFQRYCHYPFNTPRSSFTEFSSSFILGRSGLFKFPERLSLFQ